MIGQLRDQTLEGSLESGEHAWQRLVLFDIDNTLTSINAGNLLQRRGMNPSLERVHEAPDAFEDIAFTGGMDLPLVIEVCRKLGFMSGGGGSETLPDISAFRAAYLDYRAGALADWAEGWFARGSPGLPEAMSSDRRVQLGLEAGNFRDAARKSPDWSMGRERRSQSEILPQTLKPGTPTGSRLWRWAPGSIPVRIWPDAIPAMFSRTFPILKKCWVRSSRFDGLKVAMDFEGCRSETRRDIDSQTTAAASLRPWVSIPDT